jgi:hypothetical protein
VPETSPESEYVVVLVFVITDHVKPALVDLSILYPVSREPPLLVGALHFRLICVDDADAVNPVGEDGTTSIVAEERLDGEPVPATLIAETR